MFAQNSELLKDFNFQRGVNTLGVQAKCESNGEITKASKGKCPKGDSKKGMF